MVDEYQDTNKPQFELVHAISKIIGESAEVGDDDQSIYGWRGADIKNIPQFSDAFGESQEIKLEQNYRSTKNILSAAYSVMKNNDHRAQKELWTENTDGDKLIHQNALMREMRFEKLVYWIDSDNCDKYDFSDHVILYRTNAQSRAVEDDEGEIYSI